ncbi:MAG: NPCBM/NEW2 domain-containing protein [Planctomycetes bacterium]|nr:NPCBM/NEW2 domain-containing protein [Planctomycetota bacterium]
MSPIVSGLSFARRLTEPTTLLAVALVTIGSAALGTEVRVVRIDGTSATGTWLGSPDGRSLQLGAPDAALTLRFDDLSRIEFRDAEPSVPTATSVTFHLADGGRLFGELIEPIEAADSVMGVTAIGNPTMLPFDRLAAVELASGEDFPLARKVFQTALASRRPGKDLLITRERPAFPGSDPADPRTEPPREAEPAKSVAGRLISLGQSAGSFVFADRERSFQVDRVYGIVLATGVWDAWGPAARREYPVRVELIDGSTFTGRIVRADGESIHIATSVNATVVLDLDDIAALTITSDRVVHIGDLKTVTQKIEGILHRPWTPRFDRSAAGGPISLGGRVYERGLGVHSRTELTFAIDGAYETFVATIGIDDSVRPRGSVVFRVAGDGRILYDSGVVTGKDEPVDIRVDVTDVKRLRLIVDFGEGLDLADHADWADARLLKPAPSIDAKTH